MRSAFGLRCCSSLRGGSLGFIIQIQFKCFKQGYGFRDDHLSKYAKLRQNIQLSTVQFDFRILTMDDKLLLIIMSIVGENFDYLFKMVVIGDSGVGKTNLLSRFEKNEFTYDSKATIGVQFATKTVMLEQARIKMQIWDTAGQERYRAITQAYYKGASGALIVFDLTRRNTYENIPKWIKELRENSLENMVCILVGNKCDKEEERCIKLQEVVDFAHDNKLFYLQTSALNGNNVEKAFMTVIKEIYDEMKKKNKIVPAQPKKNHVVIAKKIDLQANKKNKKACCQ